MDKKEKSKALDETIKVFNEVLLKHKGNEEIEEAVKRIESLKEKRDLKQKPL